jgi:hypothetical protein
VGGVLTPPETESVVLATGDRGDRGDVLVGAFLDLVVWSFATAVARRGGGPELKEKRLRIESTM